MPHDRNGLDLLYSRTGLTTRFALRQSANLCGFWPEILPYMVAFFVGLVPHRLFPHPTPNAHRGGSNTQQSRYTAAAGETIATHVVYYSTGRHMGDTGSRGGLSEHCCCCCRLSWWSAQGKVLSCSASWFVRSVCVGAWGLVWCRVVVVVGLASWVTPQVGSKIERTPSGSSQHGLS